MYAYLVHHYLIPSFKEYSDKAAIIQANKTYAYSDLEAKIRQFECVLHYSGLLKGDKIGILSPVSFEAIACLIACLKRGIIYVPLNTHAPEDWIKKVIAKADLAAVFLDTQFIEYQQSFITLTSKKTIFTINENSILCNSSDILNPQQKADLPPIHMLSDDMACILFTSGSTGEPKGIMISHRNILAFTEWMRDFFSIQSSDRILSRAPLQFDLSEFDIFTSLAAGATIVIAPKDFSNQPDDIVELMRCEKVTAIYTVPSAYIRIMKSKKLSQGLPDLRLAFYAGEPFPVVYLRQLRALLPNTEIWNIYGPTETNIVTYYPVSSLPENATSVPIGKAIYDTEIYIVKEETFESVPDGVIGEILVRGSTVFKGYLDNPTLTNERLIMLSQGDLSYQFCRTGDLGKKLPDGNIAYHGRIDNMVKTRGYRVEIDEVESAICEINGIYQAVVVPLLHKSYTNALHAFIKFDDNFSISIEDLITILKKKIPDYMIPYRFHVVDNFPYTSTAKIDRATLKSRASEL
jgi:amino acid adenylation domain-containing protein